MRQIASALYGIAIATWFGGLLAIGLIAVPILFTQLADRGLAGSLAGAMFNAMAWTGIACGVYLLGFLTIAERRHSMRSGVFWIVLLMLGLTLAGHFGVQPILMQLQADALPQRVMESALRDRFIAWHRISSMLYLAQCLLGVALVALQSRGKGR